MLKENMIAQIREGAEKNPDHLGVKVGLLCIQGDVPLAFIEGVLGSNPVTVRRWVTGDTKPQHKADVRKLERLFWALTKAVSAGTLPVKKFQAELLLPAWKESKDVV